MHVRYVVIAQPNRLGSFGVRTIYRVDGYLRLWEEIHG